MIEAIINEGLSPLILTGPAGQTETAVGSYLKDNFTPQDYMIFKEVSSSTVVQLQTLLTLHQANIKVVVVHSDGVTPNSWQKLLKSLEDLTPSMQVIFVSSGEIPDAVRTRCFRSHVVDESSMVTGYSGPAAFAVGSWLIGIDVRNREQLLKSCQEWSPAHTKLLMEELGRQLLGESLLNLTLDKRMTDQGRIMAAIYMLNEYYDAPTVSTYVGLRLML